MISVTFNNETADGMIADLQRIFPSLLAGAGLPPMAEQPSREPAPAEPKERKPRAKKDDAPKEEAKADAGESSETGNPPPDGPSEVPDIEVVRAKLKQMGATDGLGHDKVFEVLGKYKATNASSVPTEKRADLIAEIDTLLAGAAK